MSLFYLLVARWWTDRDGQITLAAHARRREQEKWLLIKLRLFYVHEESYRSTLSFAEITSHRPKFQLSSPRSIWLPGARLCSGLESERGLYRISDYLDWNFRFHVYTLLFAYALQNEL